MDKAILEIGENKRFPGISSKAWEHPADRAGLNSLRAVPGLDHIMKFFVGITNEKSLRLLFMSSTVKCSDKQFPRVTALLGEAAKILDSEYIPDIFIAQSPVLNAGAIGVDKPFISLNSELVRHFSDEELLSVIAHELSHILSGHVLYKTLLWVLMNMGFMLLRLPLSMIVLMGIIAALREWDRKSELSADRAALLVVQDPKVQYRTLMKLAGGFQSDQMDIDEFFAQADEYDAYGNVLDSVYKTLNLLTQNHPLPVLRINDLKHWYDEGSYSEILKDNYLRRDGSEQDDIRKDFKDAAKQYEEDLKKSRDPLAKTLSNLGENVTEGVQNAAKQAEDFFKNLFNQQRQ